MRYSIQRQLILDYVLNSCEHPTAEMIYRDLKKEIPNLSLGTVYRNLNLLVERNLIKKIVVPNNVDRFDKTLIDHDHMTCIKCGRILDISTDYILRYIDKLEKEKGYKIISHNLHYNGICDKRR